MLAEIWVLSSLLSLKTKEVEEAVLKEQLQEKVRVSSMPEDAFEELGLLLQEENITFYER